MLNLAGYENKMFDKLILIINTCAFQQQQVL